MDLDLVIVLLYPDRIVRGWNLHYLSSAPKLGTVTTGNFGLDALSQGSRSGQNERAQWTGCRALI
jgi:hypothetical protein